MATTNVRYVDPNAASGGTGITNSLSGTDRAYSSLSAWEAARQADLPAGDIIEKVICSSDDAGSTHAADTTAVTIDGWTTDATRYIQIEAASSHGGKWNGSIYRMEITNANGIYQMENYTVISGIQLKLTVNNGSGYDAIEDDYAIVGAIYKSNILWGNISGANSNARGIAWWAAAYADDCYTIFNNVIYGFVNGTVNNCIGICQEGSSGARVYSNTIYGCYRGIQTKYSRVVVCKNTIVNGCTDGFYDASGWGWGASDYNASDIASDAPGANSRNGTNGTVTFVSVTAGSEDFHLAAADSNAKDQGTDTSGESAPLNFTTDIDGQTRTGTWDIGADEYVAAGGGPTVPIRQIIHHYKQLGVM